METQKIQIVGKEFDYDFYLSNENIFHMMRFNHYGEKYLDIIKYDHKYQKTPMVVVGIALNAEKKKENQNWTPSLIGIEGIVRAKHDVDAGPWKGIAAIWEDEEEESFEEIETDFYYGECELIVTACKNWADRSNIIL